MSLNIKLKSFCGGLALTLVFMAAAPAWGDLSATATISTTQTSAPFTYSMSLTNNGTVAIGDFWFAWTDTPIDYDFLPTTASPSNIISPANWVGFPQGPNFSGDGISVEYYTIGSTLATGQTLSGFQFTSNLTPQQLTVASGSYPPDKVNTAVVFSDYFATPGTGFQFNVSVVPEPAGMVLGGIGGVFGLMVWRRRRAVFAS